MCVSLFTHIPLFFSSTFLFLFCCWMLRSWGKLAIMTRLIVAYFAISWSLFSECVISEQLISLRSLSLSLSHSLPLFLSLSLSALTNWVIAHSLAGITNVCFLSLPHLQYANSCLGKSSTNWLLKSHCLSDIRAYIQYQSIYRVNYLVSYACL